MRILLTGATGFIGSHLFEKLIESGFDVAILLKNHTNCWRIQTHLNKATIINGDLNDVQSIKDLVKDFNPDTLIHLAWYGVENRFRNDYQQISLNLTHISNLFLLLEKLNIKRIVAFGSQGEYGPKNLPIEEETPPFPTTFYGVAKLSAYHLLNVYAQQNNLVFTWVRLFSIYGPKDNNSWLIPTLIRDLLQGKEPALTEGKQKWDFLYIDDAVTAILRILHAENSYGIFNLGSGQSRSIREVVEIIRNYINPKAKLGFGVIPYRLDQVMFLQANIEKIKNAVGWQPRINLEEGIKKTIEWCKQT